MDTEKQTASWPEMLRGTPEAAGSDWPAMLRGTSETAGSARPGMPGSEEPGTVGSDGPEAAGSARPVVFYDEVVARRGAGELREQIIRQIDLLEPAQLAAVEQYLERLEARRESLTAAEAPARSGNLYE